MCRLRKLAPETTVVSLLPARQKLSVEPYAFVRAIPNKEYDWRFLKRLHVIVVCQTNHARVGLFEQICVEASPVQAWFVDESRGFDVRYLPDPKTIHKPESQWTWALDFDPWDPEANDEWEQWISAGMTDGV
jgi:hypothetical protein